MRLSIRISKKLSPKRFAKNVVLFSLPKNAKRVAEFTRLPQSSNPPKRNQFPPPISSLGHRSSLLWDTSITEKPPCSMPFAGPKLPLEKRVELPNTSAPIPSNATTTALPFSTPRATKLLPPCALAERTSPILSSSWLQRMTELNRKPLKLSVTPKPPKSPSWWRLIKSICPTPTSTR